MEIHDYLHILFIIVNLIASLIMLFAYKKIAREIEKIIEIEKKLDIK